MLKAMVARGLVLVVILICCNAQAGTVYVTMAGNDANDGLSWGTAKKTVQAAVNAAVSGDQVWVAAGTYVENITLKPRVAMYGGFAGSETDLSQRDWISNTAILDGNQAGSVVTAPAGVAGDTRIDGFVIRNGSGTLAGSYRYGGGVYCNGASPTIANNTITGNNVSSGAGGGIYCSSASPTITGNKIQRNNGDGGGICCSSSSSPTIGNNTITGNTYGGIYCGGCSPTITNNIIAGNADYGIYCATASPTIINNTIAGNSGTSVGGGIRTYNSSPRIVNTIIAFNGRGLNYSGTGMPVLASNCVYGDGGSEYVGISNPTGTNGNISTDPRLAGLNCGNLHLQPDSPCRDAGDDSAAGADWLDVDGQPRRQGVHVDIGADESDGTLWPAGPGVVIRVQPNGDDRYDGSSWAMAKRSVQAAIDAVSEGGEVWVQEGTYFERIKLRAYVHLYGGFAGGEIQRSERDWSRHVTVLDGSQAGSVVTATGIAPGLSILDGFTIRNGKSVNGAGIYCSNASPLIANNTITGNRAEYGGNVAYGGGIYCAGGTPVITGNTISGNTSGTSGGGIYGACGGRITDNVIRDNRSATSGFGGGGGGIYCSGNDIVIQNNMIAGNSVGFGDGGGISCESQRATITSNTIIGNKSQDGGGGIYCHGNVAITNNKISANKSYSDGGGISCAWQGGTITGNTVTNNSSFMNAGGIYCRNLTATIANNAIAGNSGSQAGGILCYQASVTLANNTIVSNGTSREGGGIYLDSCNTATIVNTIIAYNTSGVYKTGSGTPTVRSCCVYGNRVYNYSGLVDSTGTDGNISADPGVANLPYGDAHIQPGSPCIDAGANSAVQAGWLDVDGQARQQGGSVDIGADESDGTTWPTGPRRIIRVSPNGLDTNDGSSWNLAKQTVQAAIDAVAADGGDVWVQAGTYAELITLRSNVHVYGGFAGGETDREQRNRFANTSILDGTLKATVVTARDMGFGSSTLDGFTVRNGMQDVSAGSNYGGGVYCDRASPTISNNIVTGNSGAGIQATYSGAMIVGNAVTNNTNIGVFCQYGAPMVLRNTVSGNKGPGISCDSTAATIMDTTIESNSRTGVFCRSGSPVIRHNVIRGNANEGIYCESFQAVITIEDNCIALNTGIGISCSSSSAAIMRNTIASNGSAGISCVYGSVTIANNTIRGNTGSGISCSSSPSTLVNNTVISNGGRLGAIALSSSTLTIANCIIAFNASGVYGSGTNTASLRSNCVYGNQAFNYSGLTDPTGSQGNISADPRLASLSYGNIHIRPDSPCMDAGDGSVVAAQWADIDGQPRSRGNSVDIGADESDGTNWLPDPAVIIHVSLAGNDADDGSTWTSAKRTIQAGIDAASLAGGEVWVACGTYQQRITLRAFAHVYGGFAGAETQRSGRCRTDHETILDGGRGGTVVTAQYLVAGTSTIDGFTICNGSSTGAGGGILCSYADPLISHNMIVGNTGSSGGGISCFTSSPIIANNVVAGNHGGAVYCYGGSPAIINNTIVSNLASGGAGISCSSSSPTIVNTIVAFNMSGIYATGTGTPSVRYCCVYGNTAYNYSGLADPTGTNGNISANPKLVQQPYVNVHIQADSPCIDLGDDSAVQADWTDLDDQSRRQGLHVDIGADESDGTQWTPSTPRTIRVSVLGNDANDGSSWEQAKRTVQAGLDAAAPSAGQVWVAAGTYMANITVPVDVAVYGGFAGDETDLSQRDWVAHPTILDGVQGGSVVTISIGATKNTRIDGFVIRNGKGMAGSYDANGGGIYCADGSPTIVNNTITGNMASGTNAGGGGIYCSNASPLIANNTIAGNAANTGAGICCSNSSPTIANNTIWDNSGTGTSPAGAGIYCSYSSPAIIGNTIVGNTIASGSATGGGIYLSGGSPTIGNTIIAFNASGIYKSGSGSLLLRNNCVYGNGQYNYSGLTDPTGTNGNISIDPKLAGMPYRNIHIQPGSPCVNAGNDTLVQAGWLDMDGQPRIFSTHVDIGADESDGTTWPVGPNAIICVSSEGDDSQDGSSWMLAKRTVQAGINAAASVGGEVWVAAGVYAENIQLRAYAHVYGGFAGVETALSQRNCVSHETILDGGQRNSVVVADQIISGLATLDGFTVRNGKSAVGAGISCTYAAPVISHNTIVQNTGAGIHCRYSAAAISNDTIAGNAGSGVLCDSSAAAITNCTITGNSASAGAGVYCGNSSPTIVNTIIAFNSSGILGSSSAAAGIRYCCVYGNTTYNYSGMADPTGANGNISADPKLAQPYYVNVHIRLDSPCLDHGDDSVVQAGAMDMDGQPRRQGLRVDIGADESDGTAWPEVPATIIRVSPSGSDGNDGSSWALAKRSVQAGIDAATPSAGQVWVVAGTYAENIVLRLGVAVHGGFGGDETDLWQRNWATHCTIIDGNRAGSVVSFVPGVGGNTRIDGFTLCRGSGTLATYTRLGGGIYCSGASPTVANCRVLGNAASGSGGGIYCESSSPMVINTVIVGNTSSNYGAGMYCSLSYPTIINTIIAGNTSSNYGAGMYCSSSYPTIVNSTIVANTTSKNGGGVYYYGSGSSSLTIVNTIIAFNSSGIYRAGGSLALRYGCVYGNTSYNYSGVTDPTGTNGNICVDPRFVRAASAGPDGTWGTADDDYGDLRLLAGSPCIDAGNNADVAADAVDLDGDSNTIEPLPLDVAGQRRFADDPFTADTGKGTLPIVDIGACEYGSPGDLDRDGTVGAADFELFRQGFGHGRSEQGFLVDGDYDTDGVVSFADYQIWLGYYRAAVGNPLAVAPGGLDSNIPARQPEGDANADGYINVGDLLVLVATWGRQGGQGLYDPRADFNNDGYVNVGDLMILVRNFNSVKD